MTYIDTQAKSAIIYINYKGHKKVNNKNVSFRMWHDHTFNISFKGRILYAIKSYLPSIAAAGWSVKFGTCKIKIGIVYLMMSSVHK